MPLVQLSRLRSQLNALEAHFSDPEMFRDSLTSLFLVYENKKSITNIWLRKNTQFSTYNVPESVIAELESKIAVLARLKPESALTNADILWKIPFYEPKKTAIALISNLEDTYDKEFIQRAFQWLTVELEEILVKDLIASVESKPDLLQSKQWLDFINNWLISREIIEIKLGLQVLFRTLSHGYHNLPMIFSILAPLINKPHLTIQKELVSVIQELIQLSEAETASFLIMTGELYPDEENLKFLRKCIPLFDSFYQKEIRGTLGSH
jgi:hypothetical protein